MPVSRNGGEEPLEHMLFPTHLVAAYGIGKRWHRAPLLVVAGAALPDLIDKTAGMAGVISLYQSFGHSLITVLGLSAVVFVRREWTPLLVGWASHLALDALHMILNGRPADVRFLAWPVIEHRPAVDLPPLEFFVHYVGTPSFYVEIPIWIGVGYLLLSDGDDE